MKRIASRWALTWGHAGLLAATLAIGITSVLPAQGQVPRGVVCNFSRPFDYRRGDTGLDVIRIQQALGIPADGVFGAQTEGVVSNFQRQRGLTADGIVGQRTLAALGLYDLMNACGQEGSTTTGFNPASSERPYVVVIPDRDPGLINAVRTQLPEYVVCTAQSSRGSYIRVGPFQERYEADAIARRLRDADTVDLDARAERLPDSVCLY